MDTKEQLKICLPLACIGVGLATYTLYTQMVERKINKHEEKIRLSDKREINKNPEIPKGKSKKDIEKRSKIIEKFYKTIPFKCVYNKDIQDKICIIKNSRTETL